MKTRRKVADGNATGSKVPLFSNTASQAGNSHAVVLLRLADTFIRKVRCIIFTVNLIARRRGSRADYIHGGGGGGIEGFLHRETALLLYPSDCRIDSIIYPEFSVDPVAGFEAVFFGR